MAGFTREAVTLLTSMLVTPLTFAAGNWNCFYWINSSSLVAVLDVLVEYDRDPC